jgi:hypothetical protein
MNTILFAACAGAHEPTTELTMARTTSTLTYRDHKKSYNIGYCNTALMLHSKPET